MSTRAIHVAHRGSGARIALGAMSLASIVLVTACASGGAPPVQTHSVVQLQPVSPNGATQAGGSTTGAQTAQGVGTSEPPILPALPASDPVLSAAPEKRLALIDFPAGTPIATAIAEVASKLGMSVNVDPDVRGTLTTRTTLRNVTVADALHQLITNNGYQFQQQGPVLHVVPVRLESKTFTLDYVAVQRVGTMSTVIQRRLSSGSSAIPTAGTATGLSATVPGAGVAAASGGDVLSGQSVADAWNELRVSLIGILSAGLAPAKNDAAGGAAQVNAAATQTGGGAFGSGASSQTFSDGSSLIISPMSGLISITAMPDRLARAEDFINRFQSSVLRQVLIEAKIVEVNLSSSYQFGIDWGAVAKVGSSAFRLTTTPVSASTGTVNFNLTGGKDSITSVLNALSSQGKVNVLSNEQTTALNNQRAEFDVTTDEVFFTVTNSPVIGATGLATGQFQTQIVPTQVSVGVVLDVLPQISDDNVLTMNIRPAVTSVAGVDSIVLPNGGGSASAPAIARREGDTIARMRAGETMVIGGLMQEQVTQNRSGVPVLQSLPVIGKLFTHVDNEKTRSELVIFITSTIINGQPPTPGTVR